jgi:PAS domain S-box-containing protein
MTEINIKDIIKEKQRFEALFNYATIGIIITNRQGVIVQMNRHAETIFGYNHSEIEGRRIEVLIPEDLRKKHEVNRERYSVHPEVRSMGVGRDLFGLKKSGEKFPVEISLSYFNTEDGLFVIAFVIDITIRKFNDGLLLQKKQELEDITEEIRQLNANLEQEVQKRTEDLQHTLRELEASKEELHSAYEREKELGELKSRFVTMASHEFKTPLSTILSSASLIGKYTSDEDQSKREKHIQRIVNSVNNLTSILNEFLSVGKLEEGLMTVKKETLGLFYFIDELVQEMQSIAKENQKIIIESNIDKDSTIDTDIHLLRNILINLISNAIKFSPENSVIHIILSKESILNYYSIVIADKGMGISKEDQTHLSERFFRGVNASNIQGTGLGLYIVNKYLDLLGGSMNIESQLHQGTTITVALPV